MISSKEFSNPGSRAILMDPPMSTYEDVVDLLDYSSGIALPSQQRSSSLWYQELAILNLLDFAKFRRVVGVPGNITIRFCTNPATLKTKKGVRGQFPF